MSRMLISRLLPEELYSIPLQVVFVNILGCFFMGAVASHVHLPDYIKYFLITGFLGGFTTFSAFALDVALLLEKKLLLHSLAYTTVTIVFSIASFFSGAKIANTAFSYYGIHKG